MKLRTFLQTSVVALLVATTALVSAQDSECLNLSAADCEYINTASANSAAALTTSFQQNFTFDFSVTGVPESGDIVIHVDGNGPVVANEDAPGGVPLDFAATINATSDDGSGSTSNTTLEVRLVDGIVYFQDPSDNNAWKGVRLEDAMSAAEDNPMVPNPTTFDPASLGLDEATLTSIMALTEAEGFLDYSRDGETFTFTADVGALLKSTEWTEFTTEIAPKLQENPDTAQAAMMLGVLPMILSEGTIKVVQVVDPSLNAVTEFSVLIDGTVNAGMVSGDSSADPIVLSMAFNVKVSDVGGSFTIEAPADAEIQEMPESN